LAGTPDRAGAGAAGSIATANAAVASTEDHRIDG
jgi:hypothetical protein